MKTDERFTSSRSRPGLASGSKAELGEAQELKVKVEVDLAKTPERPRDSTISRATQSAAALRHGLRPGNQRSIRP